MSNDDAPPVPPKDTTTVVGPNPLMVHGDQERSPVLIVIAGEHAGMTLRVPETGSIVIGRDPSAEVTLNDAQCSRRHASVFRRGDTTILEDLGSTNRTLLNGRKVEEPQALRDGDRIYIGSKTILKFALQDQLEESAQANLYRSATRDPLTGAFNKRYFLEALERAALHHRRQGTPLSLILIDVDDFKAVNDTHGHLAGDEVLRAIARVVMAGIRAESLFCRYGGDEFAVLLSEEALEEAASVAERLREAVAATEVPYKGEVLRVTLSLGAAELGPKPDGESLIAAADKELYRAKRDGRNRVRLETPKT